MNEAPQKHDIAKTALTTLNALRLAKKTLKKNEENAQKYNEEEIVQIMQKVKQLPPMEEKQAPQSISPLNPVAKENPNQVRVKFQISLGQLSSNETKEVALKEVQNLILNNKSSENLRVWISVLSEYQRPINFSANETEVLIIGFIASVYKSSLLDPADKPPSLIKSCFRVCQLIQSYFKDGNQNVQQACCQSWKEVFQNCMLNESLENQMLIMFETLLGIINGGTDRVAQTTAAIVLQSLVELLMKIDQRDFITSISQQYFPLKTASDNPCFVLTCKHIITAINMKNLNQLTQPILEKLLSFLLDSKTNYKTKVAVCETLQLIGSQFIDLNEILIGSFHDRIITILSDATQDRVLKVQNAAKVALNVWIAFKNVFEKMESKQVTRHESQQRLTLDQLIKKKTASSKRDELNVLNSPGIAKQKTQNIIEIDDQRNIRKVLDDDGGWVNETRAKNFIKKQTGTGGGHIFLNAEKMRLPKAHNDKQNWIKEMVMKNSGVMNNENNNYDDQEEQGQGYDQDDDIDYKMNKNADYQAESQENFFNLAEKQKNGRMNFAPANQNLEVLPESVHNQIQKDIVKKLTNNYNAKNENIAINDLAIGHEWSSKEREKNNQEVNQNIKIMDQQDEFQQQQINDDVTRNEDNEFDPFAETQQFDDLEATVNFNSQVFSKKPTHQKTSSNLSKPRARFSEYQRDQDGDQNIIPYQQDPTKQRPVTAVTNQTKSGPNQNNNKSIANQSQGNSKDKKLSFNWDYIIGLVEDQQYQDAFQLILEEEDDIYFLRLLMRTGNVLQKLTRLTAVRIVQRFIMIMKSYFLEKLCLNFFQDSLDQGITSHLSIQEQDDLLALMYQMSGNQNEVGPASAQLYSNLLTAFQRF